MKVLKIKSKVIISVVLVFLLSVILAFYLDLNGYNKYLTEVEKQSNKYGVDKHLVLAIIKSESNFDKDALSKRGAIGLMQIMPSTAEFISEKLKIKDSYNLYDYKTSIKFGVYYLSYLKQKFKDEYKIICAYNAGEGRVENWLKLGVLTNSKVPYKETKTYLKRVLRRKKLYKFIIK